MTRLRAVEAAEVEEARMGAPVATDPKAKRGADPVPRGHNNARDFQRRLEAHAASRAEDAEELGRRVSSGDLLALFTLHLLRKAFLRASAMPSDLPTREPTPVIQGRESAVGSGRLGVCTRVPRV